MRQPLVVVGGGGHGREVLDVVSAINHETAYFDVLGVLDDGLPNPSLLAPYGVEQLGDVGLLNTLDPRVRYVIGVGDPAVRRRVDAIATAAHREAAVLVHPMTSRSHEVKLAPGVVLCAGVHLTNHISLGRHAHLNRGATVGHDSSVGAYSTLGPMSAVSGNVRIDDEVFVGSGAVFNPGVCVGRGAVVGSNAAVTRDVEPGATVAGVPAKRIR